ncbi:15-hydroxyprostaglandin dehydrogenase [NAD(+)]-like [Plectropomus leopardus]|uniref:15-hydroxyprostaglandin dehydrogenase [NAD(+)]-like n=1 Tax=Plectropomus leopardus TaxID=160734 RepID=UPI001C4BD195|nr:15-hydroxyprostaglandin dehydrogenase [NAD(+)]-like [Plectropomus leopardus]
MEKFHHVWLLAHPAKPSKTSKNWVALLDVNETAGKSLKATLDKHYGQHRTLFLYCDVESEEQIKDSLQKTVETFGGVDILCNNAGILNEGEWEKTCSINLVSGGCQSNLRLQHMNKLTGGWEGVIINTASMAGLGPFPSCPVYTASKYGVVGFTRAMVALGCLHCYGICVIAFCPGLVQTELASKICKRLGQFSHLVEETQKLMDKGMMKASEVAECLLELVTNETNNGEAFMVKFNLKKYVTFPELY